LEGEQGGGLKFSISDFTIKNFAKKCKEISEAQGWRVYNIYVLIFYAGKCFAPTAWMFSLCFLKEYGKSS